MSNFDFMPIGTKLIGNKIRDTPMNQPLEEDWSQLPPFLQGPLGASPSPSQDLSFIDKGSIFSLPLSNEEQAQDE